MHIRLVRLNEIATAWCQRKATECASSHISIDIYFVLSLRVFFVYCMYPNLEFIVLVVFLPLLQSNKIIF